MSGEDPMRDEAGELPLLNVYEVEDEQRGGTRHLVGFMDPVLAGAIGLVSHAMVGEFTPGPSGDFDPGSFTVNPEFVDAVIRFMNLQPARSEPLRQGAREIPGERLYVVDPRADVAEDEDPEPEDVLGWYQVDQAGELVPDSFRYNAQHVWFSTRSGVSGLLMDRTFYEFIHPEAHGQTELG
ncbi:MAG: hypothetical protein KatS3mg108_3087 [Isosphaeraceae bacterium]|jgi:hypothetical protein|nr:MAG: hypothetical protein KatS3mg108_3087 [Isosphaeraceae bacterium]